MEAGERGRPRQPPPAPGRVRPVLRRLGVTGRERRGSCTSPGFSDHVTEKGAPVGEGRSGRSSRPHRDSNRCGRGGHRARRRHRRRGRGARPPAWHHARVPRTGVRVPLPAQGRPHVRGEGRDRRRSARRDRRRCTHRQRVGRRPRLELVDRQRHSQPDGRGARRVCGGGFLMLLAELSNQDLTIAASTIWVIVTAVLVMFMQAGFAFLEAGLTRMKNAGHIAGKNVLIFAICSIVYWAVGLGIAFGDGNRVVGTSGFFPSTDAFLSIGAAPFSFFSSIPGSAGYLFEVVFAGVSLAIVWGAMAERAKLWVYFVFGAFFTVMYSVVSHWIWHSGGWLFSLGMQDFAGSTVVHYQGALAALAGALLLGP